MNFLFIPRYNCDVCSPDIIGNIPNSSVTNYFSPDVNFCGYTIPHPSEHKINMRIQTNGKLSNYSNKLS